MQNLCEMSHVVSPAPLSWRGQGEEWGGEEGVSKSLAAVTCMNTKGTREKPLHHIVLAGRLGSAAPCGFPPAGRPDCWVVHDGMQTAPPARVIP